MFLRYRNAASGYPLDVQTDAQKELYLDELKKREGIEIRNDEMQPNAALRNLAKSVLNVSKL